LALRECGPSVSSLLGGSSDNELIEGFEAKRGVVAKLLLAENAKIAGGDLWWFAPFVDRRGKFASITQHLTPGFRANL